MARQPAPLPRLSAPSPPCCLCLLRRLLACLEQYDQQASEPLNAAAARGRTPLFLFGRAIASMFLPSPSGHHESPPSGRPPPPSSPPGLPLCLKERIRYSNARQDHRPWTVRRHMPTLNRTQVHYTNYEAAHTPSCTEYMSYLEFLGSCTMLRCTNEQERNEQVGAAAYAQNVVQLKAHRMGWCRSFAESTRGATRGSRTSSTVMGAIHWPRVRSLPRARRWHRRSHCAP